MAEISFDFRNIAGSQKCAVSSPVITLGIEDESTGSASERVFQGIFLNDEMCHNNAQNGCNLTYGSDKNIFHSQSSLFTSTCDSRLSDKINNESDDHLNLLDLLHSVNLEQTVESGVRNFKTVADDKMKTISNSEASGGLSDLLSSIAQDISKTDAIPKLEHCRRRNCDDFEVVKNECADSLSSLKVESNLSDLLSSKNIGDSDVGKSGNFNSSLIYNSKDANKLEMENEQSAANLSDFLSSRDLKGFNNKNNSCRMKNSEAKNDLCLADLLSSIDVEKSNKSPSAGSNESPITNLSDLVSIDLGDNKVGNQSNNMKISESKNESGLADLLSSVNIDKSNKSASTMSNEPPITTLSDLLSSIDLSDNKFGNKSNNMKISESKNESCLADLLLSVDVDSPNKLASTLLNSEPLTYPNSNLHLKETNDAPDSFDDFTFDFGTSSSSNNSCASSYSEKETNSLAKNNLTDKVFESDSGYNSFDSAQKVFSFFDYSSENQFSFDTVLSKKSDARIAPKKSNNKDASEEMSMSDLMAIVSPEFKNPILATLNKAEKHDDSSSTQDLMKCLHINNDAETINYDCVDGRTSKNVHSGTEIIDSLLRKDNTSVCESDFINKISNSDEQITDIDLRACIKSNENQLIPTSPVKQHENIKKQSSECFSPVKTLLYCEENLPLDSSQNETNSFEFNIVDNRKKSRVNTKQTLFSKALACKPKKDASLLQKVVNIRNELLKNIIHRPVFIDCDVPQPVVESVLQSDRCILANMGLKPFGLDMVCEMQ